MPIHSGFLHSKKHTQECDRKLVQHTPGTLKIYYLVLIFRSQIPTLVSELSSIHPFQSPPINISKKSFGIDGFSPKINKGAFATFWFLQFFFTNLLFGLFAETSSLHKCFFCYILFDLHFYYIIFIGLIGVDSINVVFCPPACIFLDLVGL